MPQFTNRPPADPRGVALPLLRTPAGRPIAGLITSEDLVGTPTHFFGGRTVPCEVETCEACNNGIPWRWHGYVGLWCPNTRVHSIFEMTAQAVTPLTEWRETNSTLRGAKLVAKRVNSRPNGRVRISLSAIEIGQYAIPEPPNLIRCLAIMWNLAEPDVGIEGLMKNLPRIAVDSQGNGQAWTPGKSRPA